MVTLWYRAPEIIIDLPYNEKSDIWSLGCILAELLNKGYPIFPGKDEKDQWKIITNILGYPTDILKKY